MKIALREIFSKKKAPCGECPYKLGLVETLVNPCPQCRQNGYSTYERFLKMPYQGKEPKNKDKWNRI